MTGTYITDLISSITPKGAQTAPPVRYSPSGYLDAHRKRRDPSATELFQELKSTVYACAQINASICAAAPPKLYVRTARHQSRPKCPIRDLDRKTHQSMQTAGQIHAGEEINEIESHPAIDILRRPNPYHSSYDFLYLVTLYNETVGAAYIHPQLSPLGRPMELLPLAAHRVRPCRKPKSKNPVDFYEYWIDFPPVVFEPEELIVMITPDPREPYTTPLSPLRAIFESATHTSKYHAMRADIWDNHALPSAIVSPGEVIGPHERDRLETEWNNRFRASGNGKVLVAESNLDVALIQPELASLATLAEMKATKEDIANAYQVPMPYLSGDTNMANLEAAGQQHAALAIKPRLRRRDAGLSMRLLPFYDQTGRLFYWSDDPEPTSREHALKQEAQDATYGVRTINEIRSVRGMPPVPWGNTPWLPLDWAPSDFARRGDYSRSTGRNADPNRHDDDTRTEGDPTKETDKRIVDLTHELKTLIAAAVAPLPPQPPAAAPVVNVSIAPKTVTATKLERGPDGLITGFTQVTSED